MADLWQFRRDTAANWTSVNPVLAAGELGLETDTRKMKIGDAVTAWASLPYIAAGTVTSVAMTLPTWLAVAGSPVTGTGTLAVTAATGRTANLVLATPNGATGAAALRALVLADLPSGVVTLANTSAWGKNQNVAPVALVDGATISVDASLSNNFNVTLGGNRTLANPTNLVDGMVLNFVLKQDATGGRTLAFGSKYKWSGGTVPTWATTANAVNFFSAYYDGATDVLLCSGGAGYA